MSACSVDRGEFKGRLGKKVFSSLSDAVTKKRAYFVSTAKKISLAAAIYRRNCRSIH